MSRKKNKKLGLFSVFASFVLLFFLLTAFSFAFLNFPEDTPGSAVSFTVRSGEPLRVIASRLEDVGLVRSSILFRWLFQLMVGSTSFPSGKFQVPSGLTTGALVSFFHSAKPVAIRVTIPEGWTTLHIADVLDADGVVARPDFLAELTNFNLIHSLGLNVETLDGLLFPDTYDFEPHEKAKDVVARLVLRFEQETRSFLDIKDPQFEKTLILASIVEREYRVPAEAPVIASVFLNRLARRIPLASCATIEYILTDIQGKPHPKRIYFVDTQIPSPFNTYLHYGLPPLPICNPGITALKAVVHPAQTSYLFFVVDNEEKGTHTFSTTWSQHEKAREAYLNSYLSKD
jgi:UPF0755 protein